MKPTISVLGSLHMDVVVRAPRLPLLGETLMGTAQHLQPGGKGLNQALACVRAGAAVRMLGVVGDDHFGRSLVAHLRASGIEAVRADVVTLAGQATGMSIATIEASGDYAAVVVSGVNAQITPAHVVQWGPQLRESAALVLQNEIPVEANRAAAGFMASLGRPVILNAAPARALAPEALAGVSLLVVNAVEAEMMGSPTVTDLGGAERASQFLSSQLGTALVVTAGPSGAAWATPGHGAGSVSGRAVNVVSTLGAGDTFVGSLAVALVGGADLGMAVVAANEAAAQHIARTPSGRHGGK